MADEIDIKVQRAADLHDLLQRRSKFFATSGDLKIPTTVQRSLEDQTAPGSYIVLFRGRILLDPEALKRYMARRLLKNPNKSLESSKVIAIAEDEILAVLPNGQYKHPNIAEAYLKLTPEQKKKAKTAFAKGITKSMADEFSEDSKSVNTLSMFEKQIEKVSQSLSVGYDRYFERDFFTPPTEADKVKILEDVVKKEYPVIDDKFMFAFQGAGINIGVGIDVNSSGDITHFIAGKLRYDRQVVITNNDRRQHLKLSEVVLHEKPKPMPPVIGKRSGEAGHFEAVSTQFLKRNIEDYKALIEGGVQPDTKIPFDPAFLAIAKQELAAAEQQLQDLRAVDKTFFTPAAAASLQGGAGQFIAAGRLLGATEIQLVSEVAPGVVAGPTTIDMEIELGFRMFNPYESKYGNSALKASLQKIIKNNGMNHLQNIARAYAKYHLGMPASSSVYTEVVLRAIAEAMKPLIGELGKKEILKVLQKRSVKKEILQTIKIGKPKEIHLEKLDSLIEKEYDTIKKIISTYASQAEMQATSRKKENNRKRRLRRKAFRAMRSTNAEKNIDYNSITSTINSMLKQAVIENMRTPRLVNRTGRLAESAKVTRSSFERVDFTYRKYPYDVFSRLRGSPPWNTRDRDPEALIRKAISNVIEAKYKGIFRPNTYIKGN